MKIGVLVSGNGTNLQALLDADLGPATIAVVISNNPGVLALERAEKAGVAHELIDHRGLDRVAFEDKLIATLEAHAVELVVLAGFMRLLTAHFVGRYLGRIVNTHPSLLPAFPGADAPAQALAHGVKLSGATIHFVDTSLDGGPIIAQAAVPVEDGDDAASLHARIQAAEHVLLPKVVQRLARGELVCQGRRVTRRVARAE